MHLNSVSDTGLKPSKCITELICLIGLGTDGLSLTWMVNKSISTCNAPEFSVRHWIKASQVHQRAPLPDRSWHGWSKFGTDGGKRAFLPEIHLNSVSATGFKPYKCIREPIFHNRSWHGWSKFGTDGGIRAFLPEIRLNSVSDTGFKPYK